MFHRKLFITITLIFGFFAAASIAGAVQTQDADAQRRPEAVEAYNQGVAADAKGDKKKAEEAYRKAIKRDPKYAAAYNNLGVVLEGRGAQSDAEAAYKNAIENDPKMVLALLNLARHQYETKKLADAEQTLTRALSVIQEGATAAAATKLENKPSGTAKGSAPNTINPTPASTLTEAQAQAADAHLLLGMTRAGLGKHAEAIAEYRQALKLNPSNGRTHHFLAMSLTETGDPDGALSEYREAVRLDPQLIESEFNLGVILYRAGKNAEAIEAFENYLRLQPNSPQRAQLEAAIKQMKEEKKP